MHGYFKNAVRVVYMGVIVTRPFGLWNAVYLATCACTNLIFPQGPLLKPHVAVLIPTLLEALSSLETQVIHVVCSTPYRPRT